MASLHRTVTSYLMDGLGDGPDTASRVVAERLAGPVCRALEAAASHALHVHTTVAEAVWEALPELRRPGDGG